MMEDIEVEMTKFLKLTESNAQQKTEQERRYELQEHLRYIRGVTGLRAKDIIDHYLDHLYKVQLQKAIEIVKDVVVKCGITVDELQTSLDLMSDSGYSIENVDTDSVKGVAVVHNKPN